MYVTYYHLYITQVQVYTHYTGAGIYTLHIDVMETDRQRDRTRAQAKAPLFNLNVQEESRDL